MKDRIANLIVPDRRPTLITDLPCDKQSRMVQLLADYIKKENVGINLKTINANDLAIFHEKVFSRAEQILGDGLDEVAKTVIARMVYENYFVSTVAAKKSASEQAIEQF